MPLQTVFSGLMGFEPFYTAISGAWDARADSLCGIHIASFGVKVNLFAGDMDYDP